MLSRTTKIAIMLSINGAFFLAEIIVGYFVNSLALVADSFHMLNDMLSLAVAWWAIKVATRTTTDMRYSYGWQRAEILGALINAVFLLALCFTIVLDSIERFAKPEPVADPMLVLITGGAGLVGNLLGLVLFHEHGHGHGHHHHHHHHNHDHSTGDVEKEGSTDHHKHAAHHDDGGHLNMKGIFLHVLGDALGNVGVIISALIIWLTPFEWRFYADPVMSLIIAIIIFVSAVPLVKQTAFILLQGVPPSVPIQDVRDQLTSIPSIVSIHELHIWQLSDTKIIASLHILLAHKSNYMAVAAEIRKVLHVHGIHSVTIQPEFVSASKSSLPFTLKETDIASLSINDVDKPTKPAGNTDASTSARVESGSVTSSSSTAGETDHEDNMLNRACLIRCEDQSCMENACCPSSPHP